MIGIIAVTIKATPAINAETSKKPPPYWTVLTPRPKRTIAGRAKGRLASTPSIDPLLIDRALPKANTLNKINVEIDKIAKIFGTSLTETPLAKEKTEPISAIGIPIKKT
jgi:hypothetical protein